MVYAATSFSDTELFARDLPLGGIGGVIDLDGALEVVRSIKGLIHELLDVVLHIGGVALQCSRRHFADCINSHFSQYSATVGLLPVEDDLRYLASRLLLFIVQFPQVVPYKLTCLPSASRIRVL